MPFKLNSQKLIILSLFLFFVSGSFWLFFVSAKYLNPDYNSDWWAVYFENPQSQNFNFTIENHSAKNNFHWEVTTEQNKLQEGDAQVEKGKKKTIPIDLEVKDSEKITIRVSVDNETREIYKNLGKKKEQ